MSRLHSTTADGELGLAGAGRRVRGSVAAETGSRIYLESTCRCGLSSAGAWPATPGESGDGRTRREKTEMGCS